MIEFIRYRSMPYDDTQQISQQFIGVLAERVAVAKLTIERLQKRGTSAETLDDLRNDLADLEARLKESRKAK